MTKKAAQPVPSEPKPEDAPAGEWPNSVGTREDLDDALEAGGKSGVSARTVADILAEVLGRHKNAKL